MKKVKRWRYYCDFCNKSGGSKYYIEKHEKGCTANPNRKCGLCEHAGLVQKTSDELIAFMKTIIESVREDCLIEDEPYEQQFLIRDKQEKEALEELRNFVDGCPACMLAAMRLTKSTSCFRTFDFKNEKSEFFYEYDTGCYHNYIE